MASELYLWINAFIPRDIQGLTRAVPGRQGQTMIDGPPGFSCFLTDQRGFGTDPTANARIHAGARIDLDPFPSKFFGFEKLIGMTHQVHCDSGIDKAQERASADGVIFKDYFVLEHLQFLEINASIRNPLTPPGSPYIDFSVSFQINHASGQLYLNGKVEPFPAFEAYARFRGKTLTLLQRSPDPGATPLSLYGSANKEINGQVSLL